QPASAVRQQDRGGTGVDARRRLGIPGFDVGDVMRKPAPNAPFPGASSGGTPIATDAGLLAGVYGSATLNGITILHLFDWSIKVTQTLIEVTAHGDEWEQWKPLRQGFTGRA